MVDALGQQRDLDLGGAHILLVRPELHGDLALALCCYRGHQRAP